MVQSIIYLVLCSVQPCKTLICTTEHQNNIQGSLTTYWRGPNKAGRNGPDLVKYKPIIYILDSEENDHLIQGKIPY